MFFILIITLFPYFSQSQLLTNTADWNTLKNALNISAWPLLGTLLSDPCLLQGVICLPLLDLTLHDIDLSGLNLIGTIPDIINNLNIGSLNLSGNPGITGNLPQIVNDIKVLDIRYTGIVGTIPDVFHVVELLDISYTYINLTLNCVESYSFAQFLNRCIALNVTTCDCASNPCVASPLPCAGINIVPTPPPTPTPVSPIPNTPAGPPASPTAPNNSTPTQENLSASDLKDKIPLIAGCGGGGLIIFGLIIPCIVWRCSKKQKHDKTLLPDELKEFFRRSGSGWIKESSNVWVKQILPKTDEYARFAFCEQALRGNNVYSYNKIWAVYNETLSLTFLTYRKTLQTRHQNDPQTFVKSDWKNKPDIELRNWTVNCYNDYVKQFPWNQDLNNELPVIVACHGTDLDIAKKICETGFAALSTLDSGFYGKGVYFSCYTPYIFPYVSGTKIPVMIISLVVPGNIFPCTEQPNGKGSLRGKHIKTGYQSHYVKTYPNGLPCNAPEPKNHYDELVLDQEAQMCPVYLVELDNHNFNTFATNWNREVVQRDKVKDEILPAAGGSAEKPTIGSTAAGVDVVGDGLKGDEFLRMESVDEYVEFPDEERELKI